MGKKRRWIPWSSQRMTIFFGGGWRYLFGGGWPPHLRHSGRRSGTHLARDGSWVWGATGDFTKKNGPPLRSGVSGVAASLFATSRTLERSYGKKGGACPATLRGGGGRKRLRRWQRVKEKKAKGQPRLRRGRVFARLRRGYPQEAEAEVAGTDARRIPVPKR